MPEQGFDLHRLFVLGEAARYEVTIEASRFAIVPGSNLASESRQLTAGLMLMTRAVREGKATQVLTALAVEPQGNVKGLKPWELAAFRAGALSAKVDRRGTADWAYTRGGKPVSLTWLSVPLVPSEWAPPLPDKSVELGDKYDAILRFPLGVFFPERGWPKTVDVPTTICFLGSEGPSFRLSRLGELKTPIKSADGRGTISGTITCLGTYDIDGMGRLTKGETSWLVKLQSRAPIALGGLRKVDYIVTTTSRLVEVLNPGGK